MFDTPALKDGPDKAKWVLRPKAKCHYFTVFSKAGGAGLANCQSYPSNASSPGQTSLQSQIHVQERMKCILAAYIPTWFQIRKRFTNSYNKLSKLNSEHHPIVVFFSCLSSRGAEIDPLTPTETLAYVGGQDRSMLTAEIPLNTQFYILLWVFADQKPQPHPHVSHWLTEACKFTSQNIRVKRKQLLAGQIAPFTCFLFQWKVTFSTGHFSPPFT